jgi:MFS family permease
MVHSHPHPASAATSSTRPMISWMVWGLGCLFYFYESILQISPSVMSTELMRDFNVTGHALGILSGIYFWSYAAMQLPAGMLMDYFGPRRLLTLATTVCALSTIAFGLTDHLLMACVARLFIGFGSAFAVVGTLKLAANWFQADRFAFLTGLTVTIGMLGGICGEGPLAILIDQFGWRHSMILLGVSGLLLAVLIYFVATDLPKNNAPSKTQPPPDEADIGKSLSALIRNKQLWLIATYGCLMFMATPVFCGLWGVPFLMFKMHIAKTTAANYVSLVFIGWMIASPLWGIFSYRIGRRKPPMYIGCIGTLVTSLFFIYAPIQNPWMIQLSLFLFGIFSAGFLPAFAVAKELCNQRYVATGLGFMNLMNTIGIAIAQPLIGYLLDFFWQGQLVDNVRIYSLESYHIALGLLPLGMIISFIALTRVRETYCRNSFDEPSTNTPSRIG